MKSPINMDSCRLLEDIDKALLGISIEYESLDEFYKKSSCIELLHNVTVPMLFLCASDDPLIPKWIIPVKKHENNKNLSFLILKGGHLGFFANRKKTNAEILVGEYYDIINGCSG